MLGAIIGDIVGSRFEQHNHKSKIFEMFDMRCHYTDDTIMTLAVCEAILNSQKDMSDLALNAIKSMQRFGKEYPHAGYGGSFRAWIDESLPQPYGSWGNGAAMRVSGCAYTAQSLDEVKSLSHAVTSVSHDHPEGIKGAEAVAVAIFM